MGRAHPQHAGSVVAKRESEVVARLQHAGGVLTHHAEVVLPDLPACRGQPPPREPLGWVRRIRDAEPLDTEESIRRYVRCHIFCLLGSTLFTDKSTAYAHAKYLPLLRDFEQIHNYSWGSACLAHLYTALCRASRYDTKEMDGPLNLLFVWAWERIPCLAPVPRQTLSPAEIPVARRWSHSERTTAWLSKTVETFRHDIDFMQEFEWRPYHGLIVPDELHPHLEVCDIVAPLLSFECVEWHPANQVMRQFGYAQPPPRAARDIPLDQHCVVLRGVQLHDWTVLHGPWIEEWANRRHSRLRDQHPLPTWDFLPTVEYRDCHRPTVMVAITLRATTILSTLSTATTLSTLSTATTLSTLSTATMLRAATIAPTEAGGSTVPIEAGSSGAPGVDDSVRGHPYDLRTERNPPDRYTPSRFGLGIMGKGLNYLAGKK
ncbi:hypothetical protein Ahy_B10g106060 [Arachis hypogaea]|uniref:Aminotransferase-like plant mobile domain-containing protein n=1 Tax=Arachis hypogaea TaxID=3818 RepID=A0A444X9M2_ARAHY|nr:hypothetical protein Ahy_B10g106060 [Arachis hypogaea]